jgi:hypothetical protein
VSHGDKLGTRQISSNGISPDNLVPEHRHSPSQSSQTISTKKNLLSKQSEDAPHDSSKSKQKSSSVQNSDDYFEAIGFPKEQYKPRPSRSRSLRIDLEEPSDFSVRPEKTAKKVTKRRKTTGETSDANVSLTPVKIQQICDMGFSPSTTQKALEKNNGDISETIDWLVRNAMSDEQDELAPARASKSKSKRRNASRFEDATRNTQSTRSAAQPEKVENLPFNESPENPEPGRIRLTSKSPIKETDSLEHKSPKVQVVIPGSKDITSPTKTRETQADKLAAIELSAPASSKTLKRKKTTHDQPGLASASIIEVIPEPLATHTEIMTEAPKKKKRGRGRPRKETAVPLPAETPSVENSVQEPKPVDDLEATILRETQSKVQRLSVDTSLSNNTDDQEHARPLLSPITSPPACTTLTERALVLVSAESVGIAEKQTQKVNASRSPTSKGKVLYRVGLSRRARIAPLLKVVKK